MSQQELLKKVIHALEEAGIEYMVTGSTASSLQGEPRLTHDIDIVAAIDRSVVDRLIDVFPAPDFYLSKESILDAIDRQWTFNLMLCSPGFYPGQ